MKRSGFYSAAARTKDSGRKSQITMQTTLLGSIHGIKENRVSIYREKKRRK